MHFRHTAAARAALEHAGFEPGDFKVQRSIGLSANVFPRERPLRHAFPVFNASPNFTVCNPETYGRDGFIAVLA